MLPGEFFFLIFLFVFFWDIDSSPRTRPFSPFSECFHFLWFRNCQFSLFCYPHRAIHIFGFHWGTPFHCPCILTLVQTPFISHGVLIGREQPINYSSFYCFLRYSGNIACYRASELLKIVYGTKYS